MEKGTIKEGEYHPSADHAMAWYKTYTAQNFKQYQRIKESLTSTAMSGNEFAEILLSTIDRLEAGKPVSDRYLLGLCWFLRNRLNT